MKHRIAFNIDSLHVFGGAERVISFLTNAMVSRYEVYCVNMYKNQSVYSIAEDVHMVYLTEKNQRLRYALIPRVKTMRAFLKEKKIEAVVCVGMTSVLETCLATMGLPVKIAFAEQSTLNKYKNMPTARRKQRYHLKCLQWLINHFMSRIIVLTEKEKGNYQKTYAINTQKLTVIPNFMEEALLEGVRPYDGNAKRIMTIGRIVYAKGYEYLVDVAQKVFARHPDWRWDIYGDGEAEYKEKIAALIRERGLEGRLTLCGNRRDIYDLYQNYGIYVMTSRYEGLPMVLLEAKVKKLPLVSFDIDSGPSDIIEDGVSGYLVPPFDTDAMAERICELIEHPELRQKFSDHAWDNIDKFRKEAVVQKWVELIDGLAGDAKAGS